MRSRSLALSFKPATQALRRIPFHEPRLIFSAAVAAEQISRLVPIRAGRIQEKTMSSFGQRIRPFVQSELDAARHARSQHDASGEFACLEHAHVLSQADTLLHVRVHAAMLLWGVRQRSAREVLGQSVRVIAAATKTFIGLVPHGNTGGTNVGAFRRMPVAPDLQRLIDAATR
jgi:hypothetical protein